MSGLAREIDLNVDIVRRWQLPAAIVIFAILLLLLTYQSTVLSMMAIWINSKTYTHAFLIFPISGYLIWRRRSAIAALTPRPDFRAFLLLFCLGFLWLTANAADVAVVQQLCLVGMIPVLVWGLLGWPVTFEMAFPLGFLFFAVPMGEVLIPFMINFTADFTVAMVRLVGIPIYREGTFFSLPTGDWSVVEACSGIRYLLASITLGCLYAYLNYASIWRRSAFIVLAIIFPIIANGLRAYMIVMIGHLSGMKLAAGVDHLVYGWVFFGLVILTMFWIGSFWRDQPQTSAESVDQVQQSIKAIHPSTFLIWALVGFTVAGIWPARAAYLAENASMVNINEVDLPEPKARSPWSIEIDTSKWQPRYLGPDRIRHSAYSSGDKPVEVFLIYYRNQRQGAELINSQNVLAVEKDPQWKVLDEKPISISLGGRSTRILQARLKSGHTNFVAWRWNWVAGLYTTNDFLAKFIEAKEKLWGSASDAAAIVLFTQYDEKLNQGTDRLQRFVDTMLPSIEGSLKAAAAGAD